MTEKLQEPLKIEFPTITRKLSKLLVNSPKDILITELPEKDYIDEEERDVMIEKFKEINTSKESS